MLSYPAERACKLPPVANGEVDRQAREAVSVACPPRGRPGSVSRLCQLAAGGAPTCSRIRSFRLSRFTGLTKCPAKPTSRPRRTSASDP